MSVPASTKRFGFPRIGPKHAQALGYVVARWSRLEEVAAVIATTLLGLFNEPAGAAVCAEMSGLARFALVRLLLIETRIQDWLDDWDDMAPAFNDLRNRRNDAVHSVWEVADDRHSTFRVRSVSAITVSMKDISADDLLELENEINDLLEKMFTFQMKIFPTAAQALREGSQKPPLIPDQSLRARAQAQARAAKQARKAADRERARKPPT